MNWNNEKKFFYPQIRKFLHQVVFFSSTAAGRNETEGIGAMLGSYPIQSLRSGLEGCLPGGRVEDAVFPSNQRLCQSVRVVDKVIGKSTFDTEVSVIHRLSGRRAGDFDHPVTGNVQVELTPDSTKITGRANLF